MIIFAQSELLPKNGDDPWMWIAGICVAGIIGVASYAKIQADRIAKSGETLAAEVKERTTRCETREDKLIEDNRTCLSSMKDLLAAAVRATELSETTVELHRMTDAKIEANRTSIDTMREGVNDIRRAIDDMRRAR